MGGSFACPECGCVITLESLSPGRQVRCDWCQTRVEAPFIPRAEPIRRLRSERAWKRRRRWPVWSEPVAALLILAIAAAVGSRVLHSRWRSVEADALANLLTSADRAQANGRNSEALASLEAALTLLSEQSSIHCDPLKLRQRRDQVARKDAVERLETLEKLPVAGDHRRGLGFALTLQAKSRKDSALSGLEDRISLSIDRFRLASAEADRKSARTAFESGFYADALDLSTNQYHTADELPTQHRQRLQNDAGTLAERIISLNGTVIPPFQGQFTYGSNANFQQKIRAALVNALRERGYLLRPKTSPWDDLWLSHAPYQVSVVFNELQNDVYLQSPNRVSQIEGRIVLSSKGTQVWNETFKGNTQVPLPNLPAYQASRLAVSDHRSREFERVLYENAFEIMFERFNLSLRHLPQFQVAVATHPDSE